MKHYKYIIWDWNGTLLDDCAVCNNTINTLLARYGHVALDRTRYHEVFGFPVEDYYRKAGFDFNKTPFDQLAGEFMDLYIPASMESKLTPGAASALDFFRTREIKQIILSASDTDTLAKQMKKLVVGNYFDAVLGQDNIYARGKAHIAAAWIRDCGIDPADMLFIGDTLHDAEVAAVLGCDCVLIAAGHHSAKKLREAGLPVFDNCFAFLRAYCGADIKACIFDLDGTLTNSLPDIADALNAALADAGYAQHDIDAVRRFIGFGVWHLIECALPPEKRSKKEVVRIKEEYERYYRANCLNKTRPYAGIENMLSVLKSHKIKLAVFSNKPHPFTERICSSLLPGIFDQVLGQKEGLPAKPAPDGALLLSDKLGVNPENILYIGDSDADMKTAVGAGMIAGGVLWGYRSRENLIGAGADLLFEKPEEIALCFPGE